MVYFIAELPDTLTMNELDLTVSIKIVIKM